eukprot:gene11074-9665_t
MARTPATTKEKVPAPSPASVPMNSAPVAALAPALDPALAPAPGPPAPAPAQGQGEPMPVDPEVHDIDGNKEEQPQPLQQIPKRPAGIRTDWDNKAKQRRVEAEAVNQAGHRLAMVTNLLEGNLKEEADDIPLHRPFYTFTIRQKPYSELTHQDRSGRPIRPSTHWIGRFALEEGSTITPWEK